MSKTKIFGAVLFSLTVLLIFSSAQAKTDAEALQPATPGEAVKIGDLGSYLDEYSSYMQLDTALHSSETMHLPDVHIGGQGVGGVTFFNGTIVNATTDPDTGADQPVTFGDNVRIDGYMFRNAPGGADEMPLLSGDDFVPALDNANDLGETERRWQSLYVSDNIYGANVIHEDNLSVTNTPTANQILSYAGSNRFTWVDAASALGSTTTRSDGSDAEDGDVIIRGEDGADGADGEWVAGDLDDLFTSLECEDGEFMIYDSSSTHWVCNDVPTAIDDASSDGASISADRIDGAFDGTPRDLRFEAGITETIPTCTMGIGYTTATDIHDDFATAFTGTDTYTITATYYTGGQPTQSPGQGYTYPIDIVKDADNGGFTAWTCFPDQTVVMWQATGY
jgi:hypothetical protein